MDSKIITYWLAAVLLALSGAVYGVEEVLINQPVSNSDQRYNYPQVLLRLILNRTAEEYGVTAIAYSPEPMSRDRSYVELVKGAKIHVMAEAPQPKWEQNLLPVRIPIRKGIQGFRLFLINSDFDDELSSVTQLNELKHLPTGSGHQWATRGVMEQAGFNVVTSSSYEGLFHMLQAARFVTFGRGINEVFREAEIFSVKYPKIAVDYRFALHIPLPTYFFVTPKRPELAERIEKGLRALIADGSFDQFFLARHCAEILAANLPNRRVFSITNPTLADDTPLDQPEFWFDPEDASDCVQFVDNGFDGEGAQTP